MAIIKLNVFVSDLATVMAQFDHVEIHRCVDGTETGDYEEISAVSAAGAALTGTETGPFDIGSETFEVSVNDGTTQTVTFHSVAPIPIEDVVSELNEHWAGVTASNSGGKLRLVTTSTGTGAKLQIMGGTALADLGFETDQVDTGESVRILLVTGTVSYTFEDRNGSEDYYYKTRYVKNSTGAVSDFGPALLGEAGAIVSDSNLIKVYCTLANPDGTPVSGARISFYTVYLPGLMIGSIGILGKVSETETDENGYAEIMLVKGATLDVTFVGTDLVRRIVVPSTGTELNLLSAVAAADDIFTIQTPDIPEAVRRT